jgi:outer membrane receptor for ferrienterochelin and colicin
LKPINKWEDTDGDGEISEDEMNYQNLRSDEDRLASNANGDPWYRKADPKTQISPRFALAFPITDKGYLHFSYGHFFQNPSFSYIYDNPEFEVPAASGVNSTMGNANMEPQRTTQYEVGFSQQFGRDIGLEITGYYKDIRNLNSTEIKNSFIAGDRYGMYVNKDHANSKGITVALSKRSSRNFSGNLDYTYSISEGNASDPTAAFYDEQSDIEPEKMLVPLDWDQRHTINGTATYHLTKSAGTSLVVSYGSGFPYTTTNADGQRTSFENNGRKPATYNVDMRAFYNFSLFGSIQVSAHINIYNLFDIRNEQTVYGDTGRSSYSLIPTYTPQYSGPMLNTLDEFLVVPSYYSAPRQIKVGLSLSLK